MSATSRPRLDQLTGLRFFAAVLVFIAHCQWGGYSQSAQDFIFQGYAGVSFFFVLSGFVLSLSYSEKLKTGELGRLRYMFLRYARLMPLHFLTALPFFLNLLLKHGANPLVGITNFSLLQSWIPSSNYYYSLNGTSWSLSDEIFFYFSFIGLVLLHEKAKRRLGLCLLGLIAVCAGLAESVLGDATPFGKRTLSYWIFYIFPVFRLVEFVFGMIIYDLWRRGIFASLKLAYLGIPAVLIAMYCARFVPESFRLSLYYLPFVALLLVGFLSEEKSVVQRIFASRLLVLLGNASFAFYLLHQPLIWISNSLFPNFSQHRLIYCITALVIIAILSVFVYLFIEKPVERFLKGRIMAGQARVPQLSSFRSKRIRKTVRRFVI